MKKLLFLSMALSSLFVAAFCTSCSDDKEDVVNVGHDGTLIGEWVEVNDGKINEHGYYCFDSDGTGISGTYETDIDWTNENDDITWYTVNGKYLYIDGVCYEYRCDGSSLETVAYGRTREYREK